MDAEKNKKLQQYANILAGQAKEAEQAGNKDEAIKHYLKLVDVFIVLAGDTTDHPTWEQYIRQAEAYQTRIRTLVPQDQVSQDISARIPPPPAEKNFTNPQPPRRQEPTNPPLSGASQGNSVNASTRPSSISKILKPFQGKPESATSRSLDDISSILLPPPTTQRAQSASTGFTMPQNQVQAQTQPSSSLTQQKPVEKPDLLAENRNPVPHELYDRLVTENKVLHERLQAVMKESDDKVAFLESRNRELEDRVAMMVSRSEYEQLRLEFENMVPKHEYDRLRTELANTVPITHYDQLLDRIANMVPREIYMNSERRILELEDSLRHSVPIAVIDDIANEVSYVSILAEVPPIVNDAPEGQKKDGEKKNGKNLAEEEAVIQLVKDELNNSSSNA